MKRMRMCRMLTLLLPMCIAVPAMAQQRGGLHAGDAILEVVDGALITASVDEGSTSPARIFIGVFGDSGCQPFTQNPGFNAAQGTFESGLTLVFEATAGLRSWDGSSFVDVDTESLLVTFGGGQSFTIEDGPAGSIALSVQSNGSFHRHLDFCMNGCPLVCTPPPDADPGVYLVQWRISAQDGSLESSQPFWFILDYMAAAEELDDASAWAVANLLAPPCAGDVTGDSIVDLADLLEVIANWGGDGSAGGDVNSDAAVDLEDLLEVIANWGASC